MPEKTDSHSATAAQPPEGSHTLRDCTLTPSEHFLDGKTYYAIVNPDARGFAHPFIITNEQHGTSQMSVGSEPAVYEEKKVAAEQLALQEEAFGKGHLRVVKFTIDAVFR